MKNITLDRLVKIGLIKSYKYENNESEPNSHMREWESLILIFPDENQLYIETACSVCMENTSMNIGIEEGKE